MRAGRKLALLTAVTAVTMGIPVVASAQATADYTVKMGAGVPHGFSIRVFAPLDHGVPTINVAKNDIVDLNGGAILLPEGEDPLGWASQNTEELDAAFGTVQSDPDADLVAPFPSDAPYKFNTAPFIPTDATCGDTADNPCVFDGSSLLVGGDREPFGGSFFVDVDANPGTTLWAVSPTRINRRSSLKINVVATGVDTQAFIDAAKDEQLAEEKDSASALHAKLNAGRSSHKMAGGARIWDAYAGYDSDTFALFDMYPAKLVIKKGDKVRWHFSQLSIEIHGVAFPFKAGVNIAANESFIPVCDPDGDGEGPDTFDVDFQTFTCPPASGVLELDLGRGMTAERGDGSFPKGIETSGLRGALLPTAPGLAGGDDPWDLRFTKSNGDGYDYVCTFHGKGMRATVVVK